jgi:hypothetical protein
MDFPINCIISRPVVINLVTASPGPLVGTHSVGFTFFENAINASHTPHARIGESNHGISVGPEFAGVRGGTLGSYRVIHKRIQMRVRAVLAVFCFSHVFSPKPES